MEKPNFLNIPESISHNSIHDQTSEEQSKFSDCSSNIWSMYLERAKEDDKKMVEMWKGDADGILVFTGLFSASVATFISMSIQDLRSNPEKTSAFYLMNIYQHLVDPTTSTSLEPPLFSPPNYAVWVNSLWFLSLAISLTCALLATLIQQWVRRYLTATQPRLSPHKQAIIREFFIEGVERLRLPWTVEALTTLLHISISLFFTGLVIFLYNVHLTTFTTVLGWVALCVIAYGSITLMPIFRHDSPYYTPLSSSAWVLVHGIVFTTLWCVDVLKYFGLNISQRVIYLGDLSQRRLAKGMGKTVKHTALHVASEIYPRALARTFNSLYEDHELERFFANLPGLCISKVVSDPFQVFIEPNKWRLSEALIGLMQRTLTSPLVNEPVRRRRSQVCIKAMRAASLPIRPYIFQDVFNGAWDGVPNFVEFGHFVWKDNYNDWYQAHYSTCMVSIVLLKTKRRDDRWFQLALRHFGVSQRSLKDYLSHGDSVLLANWIRVIRCIIPVPLEPFRDGNSFISRKTLELVSKFDIIDTLPTLQRDFCDLWNEIVGLAKFTPDHLTRSLSIAILKDVRHAYITLHDGTDSAPTAFSATTIDDEYFLFLSSSYPLCNIPEHRSHHVFRVQESGTDSTVSTVTVDSVHDVVLTAVPFPRGAPLTLPLPKPQHDYCSAQAAHDLLFSPAPQSIELPDGYQ
ncbi:hypothetical protein EI94DRAFT_1787292 [Lactarius quietus]|nr:hypothetical protein EI94DRAFT_1787292 [Lactarius quietus]